MSTPFQPREPSGQNYLYGGPPGHPMASIPSHPHPPVPSLMGTPAYGHPGCYYSNQPQVMPHHYPTFNPQYPIGYPCQTMHHHCGYGNHQQQHQHGSSGGPRNNRRMFRPYPNNRVQRRRRFLARQTRSDESTTNDDTTPEIEVINVPGGSTSNGSETDSNGLANGSGSINRQNEAFLVVSDTSESSSLQASNGRPESVSFADRGDFSTYTTKFPKTLTTHHLLWIQERARGILTRPPPPRSGPITALVSAFPTRSTHQTVLEFLGHVHRITPADWHYHSSRPSLIGKAGAMEHVYSVRVSNLSDLPYNREVWKGLFTSTNLKSRPSLLFHTQSHTEFLRCLVLSTLIEVCPSVNNSIHHDWRVAIADVGMLKKAWSDGIVKLRLKSVLTAAGWSRLEQEFTFLEFDATANASSDENPPVDTSNTPGPQQNGTQESPAHSSQPSDA